MDVHRPSKNLTPFALLWRKANRVPTKERSLCLSQSASTSRWTARCVKFHRSTGGITVTSISRTWAAACAWRAPGRSREPYHLVLPILEDLNAVQVARMQVMDALAAGQLDDKARRACCSIGLQGVATDLRSATPPRLGVYDPAIDTAPRATEAAGFEERNGLPPDIDLSKPPEVVFAAAAAEAAAHAEATARAERSAYRSNPWQERKP